jgi:hypothetical protein
MPIIRRSDCVTLPMGFCPVVAVVMLESQVARCVYCEGGSSSSHIVPPHSPASQQLQQDRKPMAVATSSTQCTHCATSLSSITTARTGQKTIGSSNFLLPGHTSCHPTLQHHNSYNRTENYRQCNAVWPPDDGHNDARNMLRNNWLPIKALIVASSWSCLYLLIKDARSFEHKDSLLLSVLHMFWAGFPLIIRSSKTVYSASDTCQTAITVYSRI